jgi:2-polyprenyl-3-methyl-5-hydroxy-6-metoxy-1,4-benzoquinol methylase
VGDHSDSGFLTPFLYRRRVRAVLPHLRGTVLDHGCGVFSLAPRVPPEEYLGVDVDDDCLATARSRHPSHTFAKDVPEGVRYDTVASMAVIEHVPDPAAYLRQLTRFLGQGSRIVLTTPHPRMERVYSLGAKLRLFSLRADQEHEHLLGSEELERAARRAGLEVVHYETFLAGANQLAVLTPSRSASQPD